MFSRHNFDTKWRYFGDKVLTVSLFLNTSIKYKEKQQNKNTKTDLFNMFYSFVVFKAFTDILKKKEVNLLPCPRQKEKNQKTAQCFMIHNNNTRTSTHVYFYTGTCACHITTLQIFVNTLIIFGSHLDTFRYPQSYPKHLSNPQWLLPHTSLNVLFPFTFNNDSTLNFTKQNINMIGKDVVSTKMKNTFCWTRDGITHQKS